MFYFLHPYTLYKDYHILNFEKDYPNSKIILLEQNYRSTKTILHAANNVINHNKSKIEKNLWTENDDGEKIEYTKQILNYREDIKEDEVSDDYVRYAEGKKNKANKDIVFRIPGDYEKEDGYRVIKSRLITQELLNKAHKYNTSLTTYLTVKMVETIYKIQDNIEDIKTKVQDIQIMVPINLRNKFESNTLCNFTLFALPKYNIEDKILTTEQLVQKTANELKKQFDIINLRKMMGINAYTQKAWIIKYMPLIIKEKILRNVYRMYGERNSCISVSNFGEISFGKNINKYIEDVEFVLTPRRNAAYNCSLISYNGRTNICISMRGKGCGLEKIYMEDIY